MNFHAADGSDSSSSFQATFTESGPTISLPNFSTGFPRGYFRIRAKGTTRYLQVHRREADRDGTVLSLWDKDQSKDAFVCITNHLHDKASRDPCLKVFVVDHSGRLCCRDGGVAVDVLGLSLVVAQL